MCSDRNFRDERISILSDSQAALIALMAFCEIKSALVLAANKKLNLLGMHKHTRLIWVPGRRDITGNEIALAKEAVASPLTGIELFLAMGQHAIREKLRSEDLGLKEVCWH